MRLLVLVVALALSHSAFAQLAGEYGVEQTFYLRFLDVDGTLLEGETDGGTEVTLSCDSGTPATATNDFGVDTNTPGRYPITLTAAEMQCATLTIDVAASVAQDFEVETYGDASARHPTLGFGTGNAEPTSPPAATASIAEKIGWLYALARNKLIQSATTQCLRNDADTDDIGCATTSDDGNEFTRAEFIP